MEVAPTELIISLLDIIYDEKENISNENNYLKICKLCKDIGTSMNEKTYYNDFKNSEENCEFLRESRNRLFKERDMYKVLLKKNGIDFSKIQKKFFNV